VTIEEFVENEKKEWLSTGEVARLCGTTAQTVRGWANAGKLPYAIFGATRKIRRADVEAFLASAIERGKRCAQ